MGRMLRLAMVQGAVAAVAAGDGETQCLKVRLDEVSDGPSLRSHAAIGLQFFHRLSKKAPPSTYPPSALYKSCEFCKIAEIFSSLSFLIHPASFRLLRTTSPAVHD
jgi:hypothetical protein